MTQGNEIALGNKFMRQLGIFDPDKFGDISIHVVGVGATGSFDVLAIAKLGCTNIHVWDFDTVEVHNQPNQLYGKSDIDRPKVDALADRILDLTGAVITCHKEKWDGQPLNGIIIAGMDSMAGRKQLYNHCRLRMQIRLLIDHRIGGQSFQIFTVLPMDISSLDRYEKSLFDDKDATELPCTERAVIDINFFVAAFTTNIIRKFLVEGPEFIVSEISCNVARDIQILQYGRKDANGKPLPIY